MTGRIVDPRPRAMLERHGRISRARLAKFGAMPDDLGTWWAQIGQAAAAEGLEPGTFEDWRGPELPASPQRPVGASAIHRPPERPIGPEVQARTLLAAARFHDRTGQSATARAYLAKARALAPQLFEPPDEPADRA